MATQGIPVGLIPILIDAGRGLQLITGTGLILGVNPRICALALLLSLIPATIIGHAFWETAQLITFSKNLCKAGG
jgi:uncharacterized membrane protein YphA (DoxX/SURF4 family)